MQLLDPGRELADSADAPSERAASRTELGEVAPSRRDDELSSAGVGDDEAAAAVQVADVGASFDGGVVSRCTPSGAGAAAPRATVPDAPLGTDAILNEAALGAGGADRAASPEDGARSAGAPLTAG